MKQYKYTYTGTSPRLVPSVGQVNPGEVIKSTKKLNHPLLEEVKAKVSNKKKANKE